jgi:hypothetical protein
MVVPGEMVSVVPLATVTFPVRTMVPDQVVSLVTVVSAAEAGCRTVPSDARRRSKTSVEA